VTLRLTDIRDLAYRFVPPKAADERLYHSGYRSWWPAHEIGHFLVATRAECRTYMFGLDVETNFYTDRSAHVSPKARYVISRELAAISISQRLLHRLGHHALANEEIQYTDERTLDCARDPWCKKTVERLLRANHVARLPTTLQGLESALARKAREVGTRSYPTRRAALITEELG
jgi:hypothetical protein